MKYLLIFLLTVNIYSEDTDIVKIPDYSTDKKVNTKISKIRLKNEAFIKNYLQEKNPSSKIESFYQLNFIFHKLNCLVYGEDIDFSKLKNKSFKGLTLRQSLSLISKELKIHYSILGKCIIFHQEKIDWRKKINKTIIKSDFKNLETANALFTKFPKVRMSWSIDKILGIVQKMYNSKNQTHKLTIQDQTSTQDFIDLELDSTTLEETLIFICLLSNKTIKITDREIIIK